MTSLLLIINLASTMRHSFAAFNEIKMTCSSNLFDKILLVSYSSDFFDSDALHVVDNIIKTSDIISCETISAFNTKEVSKYLIDNSVQDIYICGHSLLTNILSTAIDLKDHGYNVHIMPACCTADSPEERDVGLGTLKRVLGDSSVLC